RPVREPADELEPAALISHLVESTQIEQIRSATRRSARSQPVAAPHSRGRRRVYLRPRPFLIAFAYLEVQHAPLHAMRVPTPGYLAVLASAPQASKSFWFRLIHSIAWRFRSASDFSPPTIIFVFCSTRSDSFIFASEKNLTAAGFSFAKVLFIPT